MALKTLSAFVVIALASVVVSDQDLSLNYDYYCDPEMQCQGRPNVMCHSQTVFSSQCRKPEYVPITEDIKAMFVNGHNQLRNQQALGQIGGIFNDTAADMATMSWDDELELMALQNVMQCKMAHDQCRRTSKYKIAGQNLAYSCGYPTSKPIAVAVNESIRGWFDEYKDVPSISEVHELGSSHARKPIGHFTQFVQSKADRVGCSIVKYNDQDFKCILIACNYNAGNLMEHPIYNIGAPASQCKTGRNPQYPGLCSDNENYAQHENGEIYFNEAATSSPAVAKWLSNGKRLNMGGGISSIDNESKTSPATSAPTQAHLPNTIRDALNFGKPSKPSKPSLSSSSSSSSSPIWTPGQPIHIQTITRFVNGKPTKTRLINGHPINEIKDLPEELKKYLL